MNNKRVLIIGDLPLGSEVLKLILNRHEQMVVVGVLCQKPNKDFRNDPFEERRNLFKIAREFKIPTFFSIDEVLAEFQYHSIDIGFSCRSSIIYPKAFIDLFREYFINLHGGILPARAGVHVACHSIIEGDAFGGGTLHLIEEKIDTGAIVARKTFPILPIDTAFEVYQKTQICLLELVKENLESILSGKAKLVPQVDFINKGEATHYFRSKDLTSRKKIDIKNMDICELDRIVRGCDFPGHEPAYFEYDGKKIYLTTRRFFEDR